MLARPARLPAGRHPGQGRPGEHGRQPRGAGAAPRPPGRRVRLAPAARRSDPGRRGQMAPPAGPRAARAQAAHRPAQAGLRHPDRHWLRGPLPRWAQDLLSQSPPDARGLLRAGADHGRAADHLRAGATSSTQLWAVLMFEAWLDRQERTGTPQRRVKVAVVGGFGRDRSSASGATCCARWSSRPRGPGDGARGRPRGRAPR